MALTLEQFYAKYPPGARIDTDGFPAGQPYQCVDLTKQYVHDVFGMPITAYGNAVDWWSNPKILAVFNRITDGSKQDGDILVWGNDAGTFTGEAGHIGIWRAGKIYNQNYGNSGRISNNAFVSAGYLGALRAKGGTMAGIDQQDLTAIYELGPLGRGRNGNEGADVYLGKTANFVLRDHAASKEGKARAAALASKDVTITNLTNENNSLKTIVLEKEAEIKRLQAQIDSGTGTQGDYIKVVSANQDLYVKK